MKHIRSIVVVALLGLTLCLGIQRAAQAQFSYTFFPNSTTIDNTVATDFAIVGYAGGSYNDDFTRNFTGPSSPVVQVVAGADVISEVDSFNHSVVNVSGGHVGLLAPQDTSVVNINPGATVDFALGLDHSVINMRGGFVDDLEGQGKQINVSGGTVGHLVANGATDLVGNPLGSSIVNVTGGVFTDDASAFNEGILNLYGGQLGPVLRAAEGGTINIYGTGLTAMLFNPSFGNGYSLYSLTGTLEDGNSLANTILRVRNDGVTYGHSSFTLNNVPEPGAAAFFVSAILPGLMFLRHRCRSSRPA